MLFRRIYHFCNYFCLFHCICDSIFDLFYFSDLFFFLKLFKIKNVYSYFSESFFELSFTLTFSKLVTWYITTICCFSRILYVEINFRVLLRMCWLSCASLLAFHCLANENNQVVLSIMRRKWGMSTIKDERNDLRRI